MKLDELILELQEIRKTLGEDCHVFVTGWNDTGIVEPDFPRLARFGETGHSEDGEAIRKYKEDETGLPCIILSYKKLEG